MGSPAAAGIVYSKPSKPAAGGGLAPVSMVSSSSDRVAQVRVHIDQTGDDDPAGSFNSSDLSLRDSKDVPTPAILPSNK